MKKPTIAEIEKKIDTHNLLPDGSLVPKDEPSPGSTPTHRPGHRHRMKAIDITFEGKDAERLRKWVKNAILVIGSEHPLEASLEMTFWDEAEEKRTMP